MTKISDLLGKPLLSLADAKVVGYVSNVRFDQKLTRARIAEITCDDDDFPERSYVRFSDLRCDGDAAVIKSLSVFVTDNGATVACPINLPCYNQSGKDLGHIRDVVLEKSTVVQIVCDKANFVPKELLSLSERLCICNDTGAPIKLARPKVPKPTPKASAVPVDLHASVQTPTPPQSVTVTRTPGDPVKDYSFLLGKPVRTPVLASGRVLIAAGTVVSEKTIELARRAGKLVQLALRAY